MLFQPNMRRIRRLIARVFINLFWDDFIRMLPREMRKQWHVILEREQRRRNRKGF